MPAIVAVHRPIEQFMHTTTTPWSCGVCGRRHTETEKVHTVAVNHVELKVCDTQPCISDGVVYLQDMEDGLLVGAA